MWTEADYNTITTHHNLNVDNRIQAQQMCAKLSGSYRRGNTVFIPKTHDRFAIEAAYHFAVTNDR